MADSLYGVKQASKTKAKDISSSTALAFSSNLASLISGSSTKTGSGRTRPSKGKSDIFTAHNKNVKKRAAADMLGENDQQHQTREDIGAVDSIELQRSRRRLEEKARLYNAMKRGDYGDRRRGEDNGLIDFDRKWAEQQARHDPGDESDSEDDIAPADQGELIEYTDEFGRTRKGTRAQAEREQRNMRIQANAEQEFSEFAAKPAMPEKVIYGDAVQHNAFNPDQVVADRMAEIAKKRDRSATPPPDTHFDATAEVRTKGTGFYNFSHDSQERKAQMEALEQERLETDRIRKEREEKQMRRRQEIEQRKKMIAEQKSKAQADKFLDGLDLS